MMVLTAAQTTAFFENMNQMGISLTGFYPKLKSLWSCSHMNCCQHYMLHIIPNILNIHVIKLNLNLKEFQESNNYQILYTPSEFTGIH